MDVIMQIVHILTDPANLTNLLNAALTIITELAYGLMDAIPQLVQAVSDIIINIADFLVDPVNLANILNRFWEEGLFFLNWLQRTPSSMTQIQNSLTYTK